MSRKVLWCHGCRKENMRWLRKPRPHVCSRYVYQGIAVKACECSCNTLPSKWQEFLQPPRRSEPAWSPTVDFEQTVNARLVIQFDNDKFESIELVSQEVVLEASVHPDGTSRPVLSDDFKRSLALALVGLTDLVDLE